MTHPAPQQDSRSRQVQSRRARLSSMVGTTIEWYDYFLYSTAAALIFAPQFFPDLSPTAGTIAAFSAFAVGFIARPLGSVVMGHFGDRVGRKSTLIAALLMMGGSTIAIGLLPNYATWGLAAPLLLVALRFVQGFSAGGEWGGAALMAVEHAPEHRRGLSGAFAQLGVPAGLIISSGVFVIVRSFVDADQFAAWGWRIPFLLSSVLVVLGLYIRLRVMESPEFSDVEQQERKVRVPIASVLRKQPKQIVIAAGTFFANNTMGYIFMAYLVNYQTTELGMSESTALTFQLTGAVVWLGTTLLFGHLSDVIGRRNTYLIGTAINVVWAFPLFALMNTGIAALIVLAQVVHVVGLSATYGPQAALFTELFQPQWRYSGASLAYSLGALCGGGFAPIISVALFSAFGTTAAVAAYMVAVCLVSLIAIMAIPKHLGLPSARTTTEQEPASA